MIVLAFALIIAWWCDSELLLLLSVSEELLVGSEYPDVVSEELPVESEYPGVVSVLEEGNPAFTLPWPMIWSAKARKKAVATL